MAHHFRDRVEGSNAEALVVKLTRSGEAIPLAGSSSVFRMVSKADPGVVPVDDQPCEAPGVLVGHVRFLPTPAQIVPGEFWCSIETTFAGGAVFKSPRIGLEVIAQI